LCSENSDVSYTGILPALFDEQRPWATCSWLWRRERIVDWTIFRSNEDYLFEIGIAMKNNAIEHVSDVLCFIDKGTGVNTIDVLGVLKNERDRNKVIQYCFENLDNFYNISRVITDSYVRRLFYVSARLLKLRDRGIVLANIKILHRNKKLLKNNIPFVVLYFSYYFSFISSKSAFSLLEFFRNKYL